MIKRWAALLATVLAIFVLAAPGAASAPPNGLTPGKLPQGFPDDLKQFIAGTPEFQKGAWFTDPVCASKGGNIALYINAAMLVQPRLMYWAADVQARRNIWTLFNPTSPWDQRDPNKEPPRFPPSFPASVPDRDAYLMPAGSRTCINDMKEWTNPAANPWGFKWVAAPDPVSLEKMKTYGPNYPAEQPVEMYTGACKDAKSPYCEKAFFVDCRRVATKPDKHEACVGWNTRIAQVFNGLAKYIDDNTSWLDSFAEFAGQVYKGGVYMFGGWAVEAFADVITFAVNIVKFVDDPSSAVDELANSMHSGATSLTVTVLQGLASVGNFDPGSATFLYSYAAGAGIGMVVMAFMAILMLMRTTKGGGSRHDLQEALFKYLPLGVFMAVFAPAIAAVLVEMTNQLTYGIAAWTAGRLDAAIAKVALLGAVTAAMVPGGAIIGIFLFLFMIIGTFLVFIGLAMQSIALPMAGAVAGIAWGMFVHPRWRRKATRPAWMFLGVLFAKPTLFFLLGVIFGEVSGRLDEATMKSGGIELLVQIVLAGVALAVAGLAPFALMRYMPLLPTTGESQDSQPSSGFGTSAVVGATVAALGGGAGGARAAGGKATGGKAGATAAPAGGGNQAGQGKNQHGIQQRYGEQQRRGGQAKQGAAAQRRSGEAPGQGQGQGQGTSQRHAAAAGQARTGAAAPNQGATPRDAGQTAVGGTGTGQGSARPTAARQGPTKQSAAQPQPPAGTTSDAAANGSRSGAAAGAIGIGAQAAVAGMNKVRSATHTRHVPEVDEEVVRGDDT